MTDKELIPEVCETLKFAYYMCKRGQVDMRNRLRGNHWEPNNMTVKVEKS